MGSRAQTSATDFIRSATRTAHHFGFRSLEELRESARSKEGRGDRPKIPAIARRLDQLQGILANGASAYFDHNLNALGEPSLFYTVDEMPRSGDVAISLQILGIDKSIAEALLIHTVRSLLTELGYGEHNVRINSLGDRESLARYVRELTNYLRKRLDIMPPAAREAMKEHVVLALMHLLEKDHELGLKSPSPLEYLNEGSRKHFREIIEYLDFSETPYEIDTRLMGHHECYSQTVFAVDALDEETRSRLPEVSARGGRYDEFIYQHTKKHVPAVGTVITLHERKTPSRMPRQDLPVPQVFMVQIGFGPKLRSLMILEELKRAGIPVYQLLASDSLGAQLDRARSRQVPYTVILGQKEYVENTVIVRDMRSSSQESIPATALVSHLKKTLKV